MERSTMEIAWLEVADSPQAWRDAGFSVDDDGRCVIGTVEHRLLGADPIRRGIVGWAVTLDAASGAPDERSDIDGIATSVVAPYDPGPPGHHRNGVFRIDHLVIRTPDTPRTVAALQRSGLERRGHRDTNSAGDSVDMTFFWAGPVLLELSGPATPDPRGGPSRLGGLAYATDDLERIVRELGHRVTTPRVAVQPGRRIAALTKAAGCTTPIAFMSPHRGPARQAATPAQD